MAEVESFTLDHTKVKAPYVRLIAQEQGVKGDVIANYDLRFLQPNEKELPTKEFFARYLTEKKWEIKCSPFWPMNMRL